MSKRITTPREPVALVPIFVSQLTSLHVLGIDARRFREAFSKHPNASRVGKLLVVDVADARDALRALRIDGADNDSTPEDEPRDVDAVLAQLGRRRIA